MIQTDASAEAGTSGGPAMDATGRVVGMMTAVTQGEGGTVQGFNFVIPGAAVREFLSGTTVALDETSRFNTAWHAGLSAFFAGRYSRAAPTLRRGQSPAARDGGRPAHHGGERQRAKTSRCCRGVRSAARSS